MYEGLYIQSMGGWATGFDYANRQDMRRAGWMPGRILAGRLTASCRRGVRLRPQPPPEPAQAPAEAWWLAADTACPAPDRVQRVRRVLRVHGHGHTPRFPPPDGCGSTPAT